MRRIFSALLLLCAGEISGATLVKYSFDDELTDTGPDTFAVFQNAKGHVRLVSSIRYSGYRSIELRDVAGDGDFPELQGYFPERKSGELFFHFAMLVVNPDQTLNIALAGPSHFTLSKDGIAFWLKTTNGVLHQVSDSMPKRLFRVDPFVWYLVDVRYDIPHGTYDLTIHREGTEAPLVALKDQPNAVNTPESSVDKFSFVGSVYEDDSNVTFYVDDVIIGTDEKVILGPFVAPGRRKLFIDRWREAKQLMMKSPGCPPALSLADFGLKPGEDLEQQPIVKEWRSACARMDAKEFASLARERPNAPIFAMSELMALIRGNDHDAAMKRWYELEPLLKNDVRYGMIAAIADLDLAEEWLERKAPANDPDLAEQYYFLLLWKGAFSRAARFAEKQGWPERAGDALFLSGAPSQARPLYEEALRREPNSYWPTVKLSDVFHLLGDSANEKVYRQRMYGRLEE
ncbi:MAG TPA: hypothetical protein VGS96_07385 [Thermoanaerobaculia bacterium]|jgi:hypothetical protein|nr:hypothetical protein [Thermoanaerobaculia bacterium]